MAASCPTAVWPVSFVSIKPVFSGFRVRVFQIVSKENQKDNWFPFDHEKTHGVQTDEAKTLVSMI